MKQPQKQHVARLAASTRKNVQRHLEDLRAILLKHRKPSNDAGMIRADCLLFMDEVSFGGNNTKRSNQHVVGFKGVAVHSTTVLSGRHVTQATTYSAAGDYVASAIVISGAPTLLSGDCRMLLMQLETINIITNDKNSMCGQDEDGGDGSYMC